MTTPQTLGELEAWLEANPLTKHPTLSAQTLIHLTRILHGTTCEDCGGSGEDRSTCAEDVGVADPADCYYIHSPCPSCNNGRVGGLRQRLYANADLDRYYELNFDPALTIELNPKEEANG